MVGCGWWVGGSVLDFTRLMLISTQVEVVVEVGVELGNIQPFFQKWSTDASMHNLQVFFDGFPEQYFGFCHLMPFLTRIAFCQAHTNS